MSDLNDIRKEYGETLVEIREVELELMKLKRRLIDLETQLVHEDSNPHLDKDGCLYWDKFIKKE